MIPKSFIEELLARVDIVDVVGRYVKLKKSGANWMGLCPFHGEKSPSFSVSPAKQFFHCFGCGQHGTAIGFLMEHVGMSYVDAIKDLAQSQGLEVPDDRGPRQPKDERTPQLVDLMLQAERFYRARLKDSVRAVEYLKKRGLEGETAARYGLGYAPEGWRPLEACFAEYDDARLVEAGLVIEPEAAEPPEGGRKKRYDRFRDRVMFPIRDTRGRTIGFGGRVLDKGEPKYLNSPETPLFSKGRELYGLHEGREAIRRANRVVVVEGYMDVVMLAQHGVGNAVATLGTSTTPDHVRKLMKLVDRVTFAFDGDAAGRKAAWRALEACLPQAQDTKRIDFLFLPAGEDPDSHVRQVGEAGWNAFLDEALPLSAWLVQGLSERVDLATPEGRARLQAEAAPLLRQLQALALRQQLVRQLAQTVGVEPAEIERYVEATTPPEPVARRTPAAAPAGRDAAPWDRGDDEPPPDDDAPVAAPVRPVRPPWRPDRPRGEWKRGDGRNDWRRDEPPQPPLPRSARPDAARRVRVLVALHPALACEWVAATAEVDEVPGGAWVPAELRDWLVAVADLGPQAASEEVLGQAADERVRALLARDLAGVAAGFDEQEARNEFLGALGALQVKEIRRAMEEIAARLPVSSDDLSRLRELGLLAAELERHSAEARQGPRDGGRA